MEATLYQIVTDEQTRDSAAVEQQLIDALNAGTPWFDEEIGA